MSTAKIWCVDYIKGGAGGKHTWGAPGSELMEDAETDMKDPNYDSETEVKVICQIANSPN